MVVVLVVVVLVFERGSGGTLIWSLKTHTRNHGYGFSAGPDSRTRTRGKTRGLPLPLQYTRYVRDEWRVVAIDTTRDGGGEQQVLKSTNLLLCDYPGRRIGVLCGAT
jgi:hypothetical protein